MTHDLVNVNMYNIPNNDKQSELESDHTLPKTNFPVDLFAGGVTLTTDTDTSKAQKRLSVC